MNHMNLSDELRKQLLESADWDSLGITLSEGSAKSKKAKKSAKKEDDDDDNGNENGDLVTATTLEGKDGKKKLQVEEVVHVCPLCISELDAPVDEERLLEHLDIVVGLIERLSNLNEEEEDVDQVINQTLEELLLGITEEDDE